jgi:hydrophobic/amphiphilic exporter-1 (mainly G- bacteria), HAE1 family
MPLIHKMRESFLPSLSLRRPVTVVMVFIALLAVGYIAYTRISLALLPGGLERRWLGVYVPYTGSSALEVEQMIAKPVERVLRTMGGIEHVYTRSSHRGCWTSLSFRQDVNMSEAYNQLRDRVDRIMVEMPSEVKRVWIRKSRGTGSIPVLWMGLTIDRDVDDLYTLVYEQLIRPLERVDGVANVDMWGAHPPRIEIALIQDRVNAHRVDMYRLINQLQRDNFAMSSGWVHEGSHKLFVRSDSRFSSFEQIRDLPINGHPGLRLGDLAEVVMAPPEERSFVRIDGNRAVSIEVVKESMANTVEVSRRVLGVLENDLLKRPQLQGFGLHVPFNQGALIEGSLDQLRGTGLWGGLFALFILYFFLRRYRMTLVITGAIPLSVMVSLTMIYAMGWSLNMMTMAGLIIGIGMVVDNSIVVVEAIYARRVAGETPTKASIHGASEVGLAITVSTLTTVVVFLPLIFTGRAEASFFLSRIGMPVVFALLGSLLVALLFIPLVMSRLMGSDAEPSEPKSITAVSGAYCNVLTWVMNHRLEAVVIAFILFWTITIPKNNLPRAGGNRWHGSRGVYVRFHMPDHYDSTATDNILKHYESFMGKQRENYGLRAVRTRGWGRGGYIVGYMYPDDRAWYTTAYHDIMDAVGLPVERPLSREDALDHFRENAPRFVGVDWSIDRQQDDGQRTSVTLWGEDTRTLMRLSEEVERRLRVLPEISEVNSDMERADQELYLRVDRDRAQQQGVDGSTVANTLGYTMRGRNLRAFNAGDQEVDLRVTTRQEDRQRLDQVMGIVVEGDEGKRATVGSLVDVTIGRGLHQISRENGKTRVRVTAISTQKDIGSLAMRIRKALDGFEMPRGYQWTLTGRFEEMQESQSEMNFALIMAVAMVFMLMGILFESFILPLSVILSVPFSFLGVYWMLWACGTPFDDMVWIGTIVLIGVVVNNAIVLIDLVGRLRKEGFDRLSAIVEAGRQRFRPIVMTSATTIFGLVPMAMGNASMMGMPYSSMGQAMIGGLMVSTFMTLFVVPLFYTLFDDLRTTTVRLLSLGIARSRKTSPVLEADAE